MIARIAAALLLVAASASAAAQELEVVDVPSAPDEVPPGSREDQLLYKAARDATVEGLRVMAYANQQLGEAKYVYLNLAELEKGSVPEDAAAAKRLRSRLDAAVAAINEAIPRTPVAGCRYTVQHLEHSMIAEPGTAAAERLPAKRDEARRCEREMSQVVARLGAAGERARAVLDEVGPEVRRRRLAQDPTATVAIPASVGAPAAPASSPAAPAPAAR